MSANLALTIFDKQIDFGPFEAYFWDLPLLVQYGDDKVELLSVSFEDQLKYKHIVEIKLSCFVHFCMNLSLCLLLSVHSGLSKLNLKQKPKYLVLGVWGEQAFAKGFLKQPNYFSKNKYRLGSKMLPLKSEIFTKYIGSLLLMQTLPPTW